MGNTSLRLFLLEDYPKDSPFLARQKKRIFLFFLWGDPVQNRPQTPARAGRFSTRKCRSEVPAIGDFGGRQLYGEGWGGQGKKKEKRMHKKSGRTLLLKRRKY